MKKVFLYLLAAATLLSGCEKEEIDRDPLPELPDPTDICSVMEDDVFKALCIERFDTDRNGKVSPEEAAQVTRFDLSARPYGGDKITSLKGIEYFTELTDLYGSALNLQVRTLDLHYNRKLRQIPDRTFLLNTTLERIILPVSLLRIGDSAFTACTALEQVALPSTLLQIGKSAFEGCSALKQIVLPRSVSQIGEYAFYRSAVTKIVLPRTIERIEVGTFAASALEQIEMPGVTSIGSKAFAGCKFREIELPKSVKEVGFQVFSSCRNLEKVTLPEHLTALGSQFFTDCTALRTLVCRAATPPICIDDTFQLMPEGIRLYVPRKSLRQYADHEVWNRYFTEILPIGQ